MEELVCMVCFRTYSPPGHYCVNNWWLPVVASLNMTIPEDEHLLPSGKQDIIPGPSEQIYESTSVSTKNVNLNPYFNQDSSLSNEAINRNDEGTVSGHNSTTGGRSNQLNIINSEQRNRVEQAMRSRSSVSLLNNNEPGTTDYIMTSRQSVPSSQISTNVFPLDSIGSQFGIGEGHLSLSPIYETPNTEMTSDEIQRAEMNHQIEKYGQNTLTNLTTVHLGNMTNHFAIGEAERYQLRDISTFNAVKEISNPGGYESITDGLAFAGTSRLQQNVCNSFLRLTEFQTGLNLKQHSLVNSGQKLFTCKVCEKGYYHESTLKRHMRVHADINPYECKFCGKKLTSNSALKTHVLIHTDEKPFTCDICGNGFTQIYNLKTHMRSHTGEKPYSCVTYGKSFTHKSNLKTHVRIHTGEKPYECEFCGRNFSRKSYLKKHTKTHKPK